MNKNSKEYFNKHIAELVDIEKFDLTKWWETANIAFGGKTPQQILDEGDYEKLHNMLFQLNTGMPG